MWTLISDRDGFLFVGYVLAFYFSLGLLASIVAGLIRKEFVVNGSLSIGNVLIVLGRGLLIPTLFTLAGAAVATVFWLIQEPNYHSQHDIEYWQPQSWLYIFVVLVYIIQAVVLALLAIAVVAVVGYVVYRFVLKPIGRGIRRLCGVVRPHIPVSW